MYLAVGQPEALTWKPEYYFLSKYFSYINVTDPRVAYDIAQAPRFPEMHTYKTIKSQVVVEDDYMAAFLTNI